MYHGIKEFRYKQGNVMFNMMNKEWWLLNKEQILNEIKL